MWATPASPAGAVLLTGTMNGSTLTTAAGTTFQLGNGTAGNDGNVLGTAVITNNGSLVFNRFGTVTTSTAIGGTGSIQVTGTGTQVLTGTNSFGGGVAIGAGATLQMGDGVTDGVFTSNSGFANSGTLAFAPAGSVTSGAPITGSGAVVANGPGTIALAAVNAYTGGTTINGGTLQINAEGNLGDMGGAVAINGGTLQVSTGFSSTRALTLGSPTSAIAVDGSQTYTVNGTLSGPGTLNKTGAGRLVLSSAASTGYTGGTDVVAGVLEPHAALSGKVVVNAGATIDASGLPAGELNLNATQTIETSGSGAGNVMGSLTSAGIVSPGGDGNIGTLAVSGATTLSNGSALKIEVAGPGSNDLLHTTSLTLGSNVSLNLLVLGDYAPAPGSLYVIADPSSATMGAFANVGSTNYGSLFNAFTATPNETLTTLAADNGQMFAISYSGSSTQFEAMGGTSVVLMAVPEPSVGGTLLAGLGVLAGLQRFRSRSRKAGGK